MPPSQLTPVNWLWEQCPKLNIVPHRHLHNFHTAASEALQLLRRWWICYDNLNHTDNPQIFVIQGQIRNVTSNGLKRVGNGYTLDTVKQVVRQATLQCGQLNFTVPFTAVTFGLFVSRFRSPVITDFQNVPN